MDKDRFTSILAEYGYFEDQINKLWETHPLEKIDERILRLTAIEFQIKERPNTTGGESWQE